MAMTSAQQADMYRFFAVAFDAAPGTVYMDQLDTAFAGGMTTQQIVNVFTTKPEFTDSYPNFLSPESFATKLVENVVGTSATATAKAEAVADIQGALAAGWSRGDVIHTIFNNLANKDLADATWGNTAKLMANQAVVAQYYTETQLGNSTDLATLRSVIANVTPTSDVSTPAAIDALVGSAAGQAFTLTTGADAGAAFTGTSGNDTFTAGETGSVKTLTAGDNLNGGAGVDTLNVSAATAQNYAGFTTAGIEVITAISDAAQTFDLSGATGLTTVKSSNSANATTFNEVTSLVDVEVINLTNTAAVSNVTVQFQAAAVAGTADAIKLTLNDGNAQNITIGNTGNAIAGVETVNLVATGANSTVNQLNTNLSTLNVAGEKSVTITTALNATVTKVDASAQTAGGIDIKLTNAGNVAVTGGAGNDKVMFTGQLTSADSFNGGDGRDTIVANLAEYTGSTYAVASKISNVETLEVANALTTAFDAAKFTGDDTVVLAAGYANATSVTGMESGYTLQVRGANAGNTLTAAITNATSPSTNDTLNLQIGQATSVAATDRAVNAGTIATTGIEHLTVLSNGTLAAGTNAVVLSDTTATTASVADVVITGANGITVSSVNTGAASITSIDASAATGNVNMNALAVKASGATIKGGSGADTISGGAGADTIVAGAGNDTINGTVGADDIILGDGADKVVYTAATQSTTNSGVDIINDFVSGTDSFDISALLAATPGSYKGNQATFSASQNSVVAADGVLDVVFQQDEKVLWIDMNDDGLLNAADFRISLPSVATLTAADVGLNVGGNSITLSAPAAVVNTTTNTNATAKTTVYADTISSTIANLVGSTIDGSVGTDILVLTDAGLVGALPAGITNVETLVLATVGTTANTGVAFNAAGAFKNVTGSANADTIATTASLVAGGTIALGAGNDIVTALAANLAGTTIDLGAGNDTLTSTVGGAITTTLKGGDDTDTLVLAAVDNISGATVSGFENLTTGLTATMTGAQLAGFTGTIANGGAGAGAITITGATNTVAGGAGLLGVGDSITFGTAGSTNTVTLNSNNTATINGNTGVDTVTGTDTDVAGLTLFAGAGGADVLNITAFDSAITLALKVTAVETIKLTGAGGGASSLTLNTAAAVTLVDGSALTTGGFTYVSGAQATAGYTVKGSAFADTFTNTGDTVAATYWLNNGDTVASHIALADTFNITANATGTTSVNIANADGAVAKDTIKLFNAAGTQVSIAGFVNDGAAFTGTGVISARAHDDAANTVVQIDLNGDGLLGAGDVQVNLVGVSDGSAGEGNALFGIAAGALTIL